MPPLVVVAAYGIAAWAGAITLVQAAIMIGVTVYGAVSQREAARRARNQARDAYNAALQDRTVNIISTNAPWQIIYGEAVVGGTIVATLTSGDKDEFKHCVIVWAAHECEAIMDFLVNGVSIGVLDTDGNVVTGAYYEGGTNVTTTTCTLDGAGRGEVTDDVPGGMFTHWLGWRRVVSLREVGVDGGPVLGPSDVSVDGSTITVAAGKVAAWAGKTVRVTLDSDTGSPRLRVRHHLGTATQAADAVTVSECPGQWSDSDRGLGLCYSIAKLDLNLPEFQGGPPQFTARVRGRKVYDRRTGTTAWTTNNALCIDDFLQAEWGKRALASQIVDSSVQASANVCDEASTLHPSEKRYTCNGAFTTDRSPDSTLTELCQSMAGFATYTGAWHLQAGAWTAPVMDLGDAENAGAVEGVADDSGVEAFNGVKGQFYDPDRFDQLTDYTPYQNPSYVAVDGVELWTPLNFPFTNKAWRAANLARIHVERSRGMTLVVPCKRVALKLRVGQRVRYSNSKLGIDQQTFRVVKRPYQLGRPVQVTLERDLATSYDELDDPPSSLDSPATRQPNPFVVARMSYLGVESGTATLVLQTDGTVLSRVKVTCSATDDVLVRNGGAVQIDYRRDQDTAWQRAPEASGEATELYLLGLQERQLYIIRARWRNSLGVTGDWISASIVHVGKSQPPADVAGLAAVVIPSAVRITWNECLEADYDITRLRQGATWETSTQLPFNRKGTSYDWLWPANGTYKIWAVHVDQSGNPSTTPQSTTVTVTQAAIAPANAALSIKINVGDFAGTVNYSEAYLHGRDAAGNAIDAPGFILVNGVETAVPNGGLFTNLGPAAGYIVWDMAGATFNTGPGLRPYVFARRYQGAWQYDSNAYSGATDWVAFTPASTHRVIGTLVSGGPDTGNPGSAPGLTGESIYAAAVTLDQVQWDELAGRPADDQLLNSYLGYGVNLVPNSDQTSAMTWTWAAQNGAVFDAPLQYASNLWADNYTLRSSTTRNLAMHQNNVVGGGDGVSAADLYPMGGWGATYSIPVISGQRYCWSYYAQSHRCEVGGGISWFDKDGNFLSHSLMPATVTTFSRADELSIYVRPFVVVTAPAGAAAACPWVRKYNTWARDSPESWMWAAAPQFEPVRADTTGPSVYTPGPVSKLGQLDATLRADLATAQTTATNAATNAGNALSTLATMRSNGYFDASEKPAVIKAWQAIADERPGIYAKGTAYGLDSLRDAYQAAYAALASYLGGLSPAWNDTTTDTPITAATDLAKWSDYYSARQALLNGISDEAAKRAQWPNVTGIGRPADNATADVVLISDGGITLTGNTAVKTSGGGGWNAAVRSRDSFTGGAYASWVNPDISKSLGCGLNSDPAANASYDTVDAWLYNSGSELFVFNNGTVQNGGSKVGDVASGDVLAVVYEGTTVRYLRNGTVLFSQAWATTSPLFFDSSFDTPGATATNIQFGPMTSIAAVTAAAALAIANAATAQSTADGKIQVFRQDLPPSGQGESEDDLWYDTNDGNRAYIYVAGAGGWVLNADTRIGDAILAAAGAQATANGKVTTFYATSAPTADAVGDLWFNLTAGSQGVARWNGSSWVDLAVIDTGDATDVSEFVFSNFSWSNIA